MDALYYRDPSTGRFIKANLGGGGGPDYQVGDFFISAAATSPAERFGGSWEKIEGRFLLGASDSYPAESTGGEAEHSLTVEEMPSHMHNVPNQNRNGDVQFGAWQSYYSGTQSSTAFKSYWSPTSNAGGTQPHNNMPPYEAVYIWKKIA